MVRSVRHLGECRGSYGVAMIVVLIIRSCDKAVSKAFAGLWDQRMHHGLVFYEPLEA